MRSDYTNGCADEFNDAVILNSQYIRTTFGGQGKIKAGEEEHDKSVNEDEE